MNSVPFYIDMLLLMSRRGFLISLFLNLGWPQWLSWPIKCGENYVMGCLRIGDKKLHRSCLVCCNAYLWDISIQKVAVAVRSSSHKERPLVGIPVECCNWAPHQEPALIAWMTGSVKPQPLSSVVWDTSNKSYSAEPSQSIEPWETIHCFKLLEFVTFCNA